MVLERTKDGNACSCGAAEYQSVRFFLLPPNVIAEG